MGKIFFINNSLFWIKYFRENLNMQIIGRLPETRRRFAAVSQRSKRGLLCSIKLQHKKLASFV